MGDSSKKEDPLDSTMSLGDHLEELRARMILALLGLLIGTIISFSFGKLIIGFMQMPYSEAVEKLSEDSDPNTPDPNLAAERMRLTTLAPADAIIGYMKISLISGLIISSPWVFYQLWMFVAAGLYAHERRYVRLAVPFTVVLFVAGALFFLFVVAPLCLRFFLKFGEILGLSSTWTFKDYVSFITRMMLVFGIAFQTPIAIFILTKTGLVTIAALRRSRKYVLLSVFIVAAVATPPDVVSQIALALPLYALFELGILISYLAKPRKPAEREP